MAQVLVGEIVFKLKADADAMVRALRAAKSQVEEMRREMAKLNKELDDNARAMNKVEVAASGAKREMEKAASATEKSKKANDDSSKSWRNLTSAVSAFAGKIMSGLKIPALVQALTLAAAAAGSAAAAVLALGSALAPLAGALVAYPLIIGAVTSSMAVLKAGLADVGAGLKALASGDQTKIAAAFSNMNGPAREFTRTLFNMKEAFDFKGTSSQGLMPGLLNGLRAASPLMDLMRQQVYQLAKTLGGVGQDFGNMLGGNDQIARLQGYNRFSRDLARLGAANVVIVGNLGRSFLSIIDALRDILAAGAPFVIFLTNGIAKIAEMGQKAAAAGRASGGLTRFFERTALVGKTLTNTLRDIGIGLGGIAKAGGASTGFGFLESLESAAAKFREFTTSADGTNKIARYFRQAEPVMREFAGLIGDVLKVFGRLAGNQALLQVISDIRDKLVPAMERLANGVTSRLGPALVAAATAFVNFQAVLSFTPLILVVEVFAKLVNSVTALIGVVPGLGTVVATFLALGAALKVVGAGLGFLGMASTGTKVSGTFAAVATGAKAAATSMGILRAAIAATGIGALLIGVGAIVAKIGSIKADSKKRVVTAFDARSTALREANPNDAAYGRALAKEAAALTKIRDNANAAASAKSKAANAGLGSVGNNAVMQVQVKREGFEATQKAFKDLGVEVKNYAEVDKVLAKYQEESKAIMAEVTAEALRQQAGYQLLTGANVDLGNAWEQSGKSAGELIAAQTQVAITARDAVIATGDLASIFNSTTFEPGKNVFAAFKASAQATLDEATRFAGNITKAMTAGYDPALIGQLVSKGPKEAGPILDSLVRNASQKNIKFFNTYSETLGKIATQVAESARIMQNAVDSPTSDKSQNIGKAQAIAAAFFSGAGSAQQIADRLKIGKDEVLKIAALFGQRYILDVEMSINTETARRAIQQTLAYERGFGPNPNIARPTTTRSTTVTRSAPSRSTNTDRITQAMGGIVKFFGNGGMENHTAQIAPAGAMRVWAEPETGGEAYIPLAKSKRPRSMSILKQTAAMMGMKVAPFADGGVYADAAGNAPSTPAQSDAAARKAEAAANRVIAAQEKAARIQEKAAADAAAKIARALQLTIDKLVKSLTAMRDKIVASYEKVRDFRVGIRDAAVQRGALTNLSIGKSQPTSIQDITRTIQDRAFANRQFAGQISKIGKSGLDKNLLAQIAQMGPGQEGSAIAASFANASVADIRKANEAQKTLMNSAGGLGNAAGTGVNGAMEGKLLAETTRQTAVLERLLDALAGDNTNASNSNLINQLIAALQNAKSRGRTLGLA